MEARIFGVVLACAALGNVAATHRTTNFVVTAESADVARQIGEHAEHYRRELAVKWLNHELPPWNEPCPVFVKVGQVGAGGDTSFVFDHGEVFDWKMKIQGPLDRLLDSVLPHEVSHTIFACHFRRPLPRWADEGAATLAEDEGEKRRQKLVVKQILSTQKRIPLQELLRITEYPQDMQKVLSLYAEGYALCELLVQRNGKERYLKFLADAHTRGWERAFKTHYGYDDIRTLEKEWEGWIIAGCPGGGIPKDQQIADARSRSRNAGEEPVVRSQTPDGPVIANQKASLNDRKPAARQNDGNRPGQGLNAPAPRRRPETSASLAAQIDLGESEPADTFQSIEAEEAPRSESRPQARSNTPAPSATRAPRFNAASTTNGWVSVQTSDNSSRSPRSRSARTQ